MATKEFDLSLGDTKQKSFNVNSVSNQNDQYNNLNLNANFKCSTDNPVHQKNESFHSKSTKKYYDDTEDQKRWKNESKDSGSTLSLHIKAYETSAEVEGGQNNSDKSFKSKSNQFNKTLKGVNGIFRAFSLETLFEIPRQQEDTKSEPEVMQHRASQKLVNLNDQTGSDASPTMGSLVSTVCDIRRALATVGMENAINFPQIVVIGTQSHGKSSVIEGIVGRDFLPRGTGICTRRPLLIQLICTPLDHPMRKEDKKTKNVDWATFDHLTNTKFFDFKDVRKEIEKATDELPNKKVSDEEIHLKIYAKNVVDLTLIDLPGFTKVAVGDQPPDIEDQIRQMSEKYISNPNSIILAVVKATEDFATSEALKFAKQVDSNGNRTLGVLTQLDLMDKGTDATKTLKGELIPVKLGIIGVVGRSQKDINDGKTVKDCLDDEVKFLKREYPTLASENGIPITNNFCYIFVHNGSFANKVFCFRVGGALLLKVYEESFADEMKAIDALEGLNDEAILIAKKNVQGSTAEFLPNEKVFRALVKRQFLLFNHPSRKCVDSIHTQLLSIVADCKSEMQRKEPRFPVLLDIIEDEITGYIKKRIKPTKEDIQSLLDDHRGHINTNHPGFTEATAKAIKDLQDFKENNAKPATPAVASTQQQQQPTGDQQPKKDLTELEKKYAELMKDLVRNYFNIVRTSVQDEVPKRCTRELVDYLKERILKHFIETLQGNQKYSKNIDLFSESESMAQERKETSAKLAALIEAKKVLNGIPETLL
uniref:Uncharacterized protein n=1 Tax=Panagrolaimus davidi TaxID=227884 RepID=A0A914PGL0_9BILA